MNIIKDAAQSIKKFISFSAAHQAMKACEAFIDFENRIYNTETHFPTYMKKLHDAKIELLNVNHDALYQTVLNTLFDDSILYSTMEETHTKIFTAKQEIETHLAYTDEHLTQLGAQKIKKNATVFVYGYSSYAVKLLLRAKALGTAFTTRVCEVRPNHSGQRLADELSLHGIVVEYYSEAALRIAIKDADIVLLSTFGIDEKHKIYSILGSELVCDVAKHYGVPVYVCADTWKRVKKVTLPDELDPALLFPGAKEGIFVRNYGYEKIHSSKLKGIICEKGILKVDDFMKL